MSEPSRNFRTDPRVGDVIRWGDDGYPDIVVSVSGIHVTFRPTEQGEPNWGTTTPFAKHAKALHLAPDESPKLAESHAELLEMLRMARDWADLDRLTDFRETHFPNESSVIWRDVVNRINPVIVRAESLVEKPKRDVWADPKAGDVFVIRSPYAAGPETRTVNDVRKNLVIIGKQNGDEYAATRREFADCAKRTVYSVIRRAEDAMQGDEVRG
jgi:hypothetical protein